MLLLKPALVALIATLASAQQYAGDIISANLPTISGAEVAFFKIPDPSGKNNNLTLINYYSHGTNGQRIVESNIQRAVIVLHGLLRDPFNYENDNSGYITPDNVAILAPYFPNGDDKNFGYPWTDGLASGQGSTSNALVWSGSQWSAGADNHYPHNSRHTSSYYVLDTLVKYFDNKTLFPNVKQIVLVGHSLGGQMLQRYAAVGDQLNTTTPLTYWIGNPDSYAWLSEDRPLNTAECPIYDVYRAGYTNYTEYPMTYGTDIVAQGRAALVANYQSRQIAYGRALLDHGNHASDCAANTTGADRNERFFFFIKAFPPSCANPTGTNCDTVDLIPVQHDNGQMFNSNAGQSRIFYDNWDGKGGKAYDYGYPRDQSGDDPYPNPSLVNESGVTNYNTYAGGLTYQGCWSDQVPASFDSLATMVYANASNTIELCTNACVADGYSIAGMENGSQCWCGNSVQNKAAVVVDTSCNIPCPGNTKEVCGGPTRLSLFSKGFPTSS
nr:wsc domain-containing protein [Quercus suber]